MLKKLVTPIGVVVALGVGCTSSEPTVKVYKVAKEKLVSGSSLSSGSTQASGLSWKLPSSWKQVPGSSSMRLASFKTGPASELTLVALTGSAGGELANFNRWQEQVGVSASSAREMSTLQIKSNGKMGDFSWFKIYGSERAILVASLKWGEQTLFVKMSGPVSDLKKQETRFLKFAQSVHPTQ